LKKEFITIQEGLYYFRQGFHLITQPGIRHLVIIPFLLNLILFVILVTTAIHFFNLLIIQIDQYLPSWLHFIEWILWVIFVMTFLIVVSYTFSLLANLISAPFNAFLSEKVQRKLTGKVREISAWQAIKETPKTLMRALEMLGYYIPRSLGILVLSFIPIINIFVPILWLLFNSWSMAIQYFNYPFENNAIDFRLMRQYLQTRKFAALSFGGLVMLCSLVPVLNIIVISAATAGATAFWASEQKEGNDHALDHHSH
jgi:CysZ protein